MSPPTVHEQRQPSASKQNRRSVSPTGRPASLNLEEAKRRMAGTYAFIAFLGCAIIIALRHAHEEGKLALATALPPPAPGWLLLFRVLSLAIILGVDVHIFLAPPMMLAGTTRFGEIKTIPLRGIVRFTTFTVWAWNIQGAYFAATLALSLLPHSSLPWWLPAAARLALEVSLPLAMLVTSIVTHALYPMAIKRGTDPAILFKPGALLMHNANLVMMLVELFAPGAFTLHAWHALVTALLGLIYVVFANLNERFGIGAFYYPFLAPGKRFAIAAHAGLVLVLVVCGLCMAGLQYLYLHVHGVGAVGLTAALTSQLIMLRRPKKH